VNAALKSKVLSHVKNQALVLEPIASRFSDQVHRIVLRIHFIISLTLFAVYFSYLFIPIVHLLKV
jgi:hypothetical protein